MDTITRPLNFFSCRIITPVKTTPLRGTKYGELPFSSGLEKFEKLLDSEFDFKFLKEKNGRIYARTINGEKLLFKISSHRPGVLLFTLKFKKWVERCQVVSKEFFDRDIDLSERYILLASTIMLQGSKRAILCFPYRYPEVLGVVLKSLATEKIDYTQETELYRVRDGFVLLIPFYIGNGASRYKISSYINEILDILSYLLAYQYLSLLLMKKILKLLSSDLSKPWIIRIQKRYQDYTILNSLIKENTQGIERALESLMALETSVSFSNEMSKPLEDMKFVMLEEIALDPDRLGENVNLHMFFVSILIAILAILVTVIISFGDKILRLMGGGG